MGFAPWLCAVGGLWHPGGGVVTAGGHLGLARSYAFAVMPRGGLPFGWRGKGARVLLGQRRVGRWLSPSFHAGHPACRWWSDGVGFLSESQKMTRVSLCLAAHGPLSCCLRDARVSGHGAGACRAAPRRRTCDVSAQLLRVGGTARCCSVLRRV